MTSFAPTYIRRDPRSSVLHKVFQNHWPAFLNTVQNDTHEKHLPQFIVKEVQDYFNCGILANGFIRLYCKDCKKSQLVAFSCKRRGFCPSCCAKRMNHTATHLVDSVLPHVGVRQWVLSFPFSLRYLMAYNPKLTSQCLRAYIHTIQSYYRKKAKEFDLNKTQCGAVTVIQRAGGALNSNIHFHTLFLDGVYFEEKDNLRFQVISEPDADDIKVLILKIKRKIIRLLKKQGYLDAEYIHDESVQDILTKNSLQQLSLDGQHIQRLKNELFETKAKYTYEGGINISGFSLHAKVKIDARHRKKLEKLCGYVS